MEACRTAADTPVVTYLRLSVPVLCASMLPDMTEFPSDREADLDMNYAVNAYTELQDVIRPRGDMV